jgi:hypothetical protein
VDLIHALLKLKSNDIQVNRIFVNYYYNNNRNKFQTQYYNCNIYIKQTCKKSAKNKKTLKITVFKSFSL